MAVQEQYIRHIGSGKIRSHGNVYPGGLGLVPDGYELVVGELPDNAEFEPPPAPTMSLLYDLEQELVHEPDSVKDVYLEAMAQVVAFAAGGRRSAMKRAIRNVPETAENRNLRRRLLNLFEDDD